MLEFENVVGGGKATLIDVIGVEMQEGLTLDFKAPGLKTPAATFTPEGKLTREGRAA